MNSYDYKTIQDNMRLLRGTIREGRALLSNPSTTDVQRIRFNAVADQQLAGMDHVSLEEYDDIDATRRRVVSLEGMFDGIKKLLGLAKTEGNAIKEPSHYERMRWFNTNSADLINNYKEDDKTVKLSLIASGLFSNGNDILVELSNDLKEYRAVFNTYKPELDKLDKFIRGVYARTNTFAGNLDHPDDFLKVIKELNARQPSSIAKEFKEPDHTFIGFNGESFTRNSRSGVIFDTSISFVMATEAREVHKPNADTFKNLCSMVGELTDLLYLIEYYKDERTVAPDFTDPPFRGYLDFDEIELELSKAKWEYNSNYDRSEGLLYILVERLGRLIGALIGYIQAVSK